MPTWPSTLPDKPLQQGYEEQPRKDVLRTSMDQGPAKVRRRGTAKPVRVPMELHLTSDQADTLASFVDDDLEDGTLRFDWEHPRTGDSVQFRFVFNSGEAPYTLSVVGGTLYVASATLEILP
ncbi:MAG: hypothetical protein ACOCUM_00300 [Thiohalospira sp.]